MRKRLEIRAAPEADIACSAIRVARHLPWIDTIAGMNTPSNGPEDASWTRLSHRARRRRPDYDPTMRRNDIPAAPTREGHGVRRFGVARVHAFGAFARDEASPGNDVDALADTAPLSGSMSEDDQR